MSAHSGSTNIETVYSRRLFPDFGRRIGARRQDARSDEEQIEQAGRTDREADRRELEEREGLHSGLGDEARDGESHTGSDHRDDAAENRRVAERYQESTR